MYCDHAFTAFLATGGLLTEMIADLVPTLAWRFAMKDVVHRLGVASRLTSMTAVQAVGAWLLATTFRAKPGKVFRLLNLDESIRMSQTAQM